jgi:hypothetical protein
MEPEIKGGHMSKIRKRLPSPAMIIAVVALVAAVGGTAVAASTLTNKAFKNKAVRGPVTFVTTTTAIPAAVSTPVSAACPGGTTVVGGGIKVTKPYATGVESSSPTTTGWAGDVYSSIATSATTTAICAKAKTAGAPPGA